MTLEEIISECYEFPRISISGENGGFDIRHAWAFGIPRDEMKMQAELVQDERAWNTCMIWLEGSKGEPDYILYDVPRELGNRLMKESKFPDE